MDAAAATAAAANDDDDPQSPTPTPPRAGPTPTSTFASVTVAANPLPSPHTLTLALPIQAAANPNNNGGGGRDDCWSEGATSALIDAWGERYLDLGRGNLNQKHWQEVADAVSARDDHTKPPKSDVQCKNRIDTLKKKYKSEKSKIASSWPFFHRLDILIGPNFMKPPASASAPAFPPQFPQKTRTQTVVNHTTSIKKRSKSLPPPPPPPPPPPQEESHDLPPAEGEGEGVGVRELTRAILRFGEVYERVERAKVQQMAEVEKQRMGFARELQLQRMQFFVKTQRELSQLERQTHKRSRGGGGENNHRLHRRHHQSAVNGNNNE